MIFDATSKPLVVFGFVSTLVDSAPRYIQALANTCEAFGIPKPDENSVHAMLGEKNLQEIVNSLNTDMTDNDKLRFMVSCNTQCDFLLQDANTHENLFPGAFSTLHILKEQGYSLGIFTGTRREIVDTELQHNHIHHLFDQRYIRAKQSDDGFVQTKTLKAQQLKTIKDMYNAESRIIVVGDSSADATVAANLDMGFIGFSPTVAKHDKLKQLGVELTFKNYFELPDLLQNASQQKKTIPLNNAVSLN